MSVDARVTPYGAPAYAALLAAVAELKGEAPLRPVRVLVPSDRVAVTARRALARGAAGSPGVAALEVLTVRRLAEQRAGQRLAEQGRRPLTDPVLAGVVRGVLREAAGLFAPVAEHPATVRALAQAHRTLRGLTAAELEGLDGETSVPSMVGEVVRLHGLIHAAWQGRFFDEFDLVVEAAEGAPDGVATVVFLAQELSRAELVLLRMLAESASFVVLAGITGVPAADAEILAPWGLDSAKLPEPVATQVMCTTDPDDEVRHVVRAVVAALAERPGHRIAVLYGSPDPYARLLHEHFARTGLLLNGRSVRPVVELGAGRAVRRLFALPEHGFRRDEVLALVADAPVRWGERRAPSSRWVRLSRAAGVVRDQDWDQLADLGRRLVGEAATERAKTEPQLWLAERKEREATDAAALHGFVGALTARLADLDSAPTWARLSEVAVALWDELFGDVASWLAPEEMRAAERVRAVLYQSRALDGVAGLPSRAAVADVLELELSDALDRAGRAGEGVFVAEIGAAIGVDVDRVYVLGLAEGAAPAHAGEDPLLPEEARVRTGGVLPTVRDRLARRHRHVLAAFAGAEQAVACYPRGDLRRGGDRVPSRWVLPSLRILSGQPDRHATDPLPADAVGIVQVASHAGALETTTTPADEQEWHQRRLAAVRRRGEDPAPELMQRQAAAAAVISTRARASASLTRFDGNLVGAALPDPTTGRAIAPTALEAWTACPHAYFLRYVLGVSEIEDPEEVVRISAAEKGNVVHRALEWWLQEQIEAGVPTPDAPWPPAARARLLHHAEAACARAVAEGVTGYPLLWEQDKAALIADLEAFLGADDARRAGGSLTPVGTELPFGIGGKEPVHLDLGDGLRLALRGRADRVDETPDGLVACDYKSGGVRAYEGLSAENPTRDGSRFQLPAYALAAAASHPRGDGRPRLRAEYWFTSRRARFARVGYDVDVDLLARTAADMRVVVEGIRGGVFPARPNTASWGCPSCDLTGDAVVERAWTVKASDPLLAGLRGLVGLDPPPQFGADV